MDVSVQTERMWIEFVGSRSASLRERLITEYMPLVRFVVGRLGIPPTTLLEAEDLMSYGVIGLITAIDRYEPERGIRFEAFATPRIRGAVIDHLRSTNWLPRSAVARVRQLEGVLASLEQSLGRPAKEEEVAVELGVPVERYRQMLLDVSTSVLSLDAPIGSSAQEDEPTTLRDLVEDQSALSPSEEVEQRELAGALSVAIEQLPEREKLLLSLYYQEELTMKEISKIMSVSESRVCQLHMQAVMRLRGALRMVLTGSETAIASKKNTIVKEFREKTSNEAHVQEANAEKVEKRVETMIVRGRGSR